MELHQLFYFGSSELLYRLLLVVFGTGAEMFPAKRDRVPG